MSILTRFAPSPTGYLHVGGARTALYCWLYAKQNKGTFILRVEDTDVERSTAESVQAILDGMEWLRLDYDQGPIHQSDRFPRYKEVAEKLLAEDKAYRCYCSKERLEELRTKQMENKEKPRYDGFCRDKQGAQEGSFVIRFRNPDSGVVAFDDLVRGHVSFNNEELDDLIIIRSDGIPTYNFSVVVDDSDMKITHVIRGDDHINNTPRQINILRALGLESPIYAHVPMILGSDGKRLSKRHGAVSVMQYREDGYLPDAVINYLARLGWSHGDQEIFSREELIDYFDVNHLSRSPAAFNTEKLIWLNHHYIKNGDPEEVAKELAWHLVKLGVNIMNGPALEDVIKVQADRSKTLKEMAEKSRCFYVDVEFDEEAVKQHLTAESLPVLEKFLSEVSQVSEWNKENLHHVIAKVCEELNVKMPKLAQPIRVAMVGSTVSPSVDATLALFGKEKTLQRLQAGILKCKS